MKPILIVATIAAGMVGIFTLTVFDAGLISPAAPGSIIAVLAATPSGSFLGVGMSVLLAATTSFVIASIILRASRRSLLDAETEGGLAAATSQMEGMKGKKSSVSSMLVREEEEEAKASGMTLAQVDEAEGIVRDDAAPSRPVHKIVFACDAGMGSSAMGASVLRNKVKKAGFSDITVVNVAIANLTDDIDLIVTHQDLTAQGPAEGAERTACLGVELHEQSEVRRDRGRTQGDQPAGHRRPILSTDNGGTPCAFPIVVSTPWYQFSTPDGRSDDRSTR